MEQEVNKKKLFVASLSFKMRDGDLQEIFNTIGNVVNAKVVMNRDGRSKGYGFVEMASEEEAQYAISQLNGTVHFGREIVVNPQLPKDQQQGYTTFRKAYNPQIANDPQQEDYTAFRTS